MKKNAYLDIQVPSGGVSPPQTKPDFVALPCIFLALAKRNTGKTCALTNILHMAKHNDVLDRCIVVSGTFPNNEHYFRGLPVDHENDILEPQKNTAEIIIEMLDEMGREYDEYHKRIQQWNELQNQIKSNRNIDLIDDDLLLSFENDFEKPTYKYMRNGKAYKPVVWVFFDDCQGSGAFAPSSQISHLVIKHRHLGKTIHKAIGCNLMFATQSYTSNSLGLPKSIRTNLSHMLIFKNKNLNELMAVSAECAGEVSQEEFFKVYEKAIQGPHDFLFIDLQKKASHPSMFRRNMNECLVP